MKKSKNLTVGLSISQSGDLGKLGFGKSHLDDANIEIARYLLHQGHKLAYGGDLRTNGFTEQLFGLVKSYALHSQNSDNGPYLYSYLGFPISNNLTVKQQTDLLNDVTFEKLELPDELNMSSKDMIEDLSIESRYNWFRSMSHLREKMNNDIDARIVLGGQSKGFKSKYSGIVEEVILAMKSKKPVYLCGAFGGATYSIIEVLTKGKSDRLKVEYFEGDVQYLGAINLFNLKHETNKIDYEEIVDFFRKTGINGLNNGLNDDENKTLFQTIHIPEMISLILKGLKKIQSQN